MMYTPKRGYRVCLHCGKILSTKKVVKRTINGKSVKVCGYCGEPEKVSTGNDILTMTQAVDLFVIADMKAHEDSFALSRPEIEAKYEQMYDNCLIPHEVRV